MKTQYDWTKRVVSLENLRAMCARISGTCHRFTVDGMSPNRVVVAYSNPDEYGNERPTLAHYPAYGDKENPSVVLDAVRFTGGRPDDESWQSFMQLTDCPVLWRDPVTGNWASEYEIGKAEFPGFVVTSSWDKDGCVQTWFCAGRSFRSFDDASAYAVEQMKIARRAARETVRPVHSAI